MSDFWVGVIASAITGLVMLAVYTGITWLWDVDLHSDAFTAGAAAVWVSGCFFGSKP